MAAAATQHSQRLVEIQEETARERASGVIPFMRQH